MPYRDRVWKVAILLGFAGLLCMILQSNPWHNIANAFQPRPVKQSNTPRTGSGSRSPSISRPAYPSSKPPTKVNVSKAQPVARKPSLLTRAGDALRNLFRSRANSRKEAPQIAGRQKPITPRNQPAKKSPQELYGPGQQLAYQNNAYLFNNGNAANPLAQNFGGAWNIPGANRVNYFGNNLPAGHPFNSNVAYPNGGAAYFRPMQNTPVNNQGLRYGIMSSSPGAMPQLWAQGGGFGPVNPALRNLPPRAIPASSHYAPAPMNLLYLDASNYGKLPELKQKQPQNQKVPQQPVSTPAVVYEQLPPTPTRKPFDYQKLPGLASQDARSRLQELAHTKMVNKDPSASPTTNPPKPANRTPQNTQPNSGSANNPTTNQNSPASPTRTPPPRRPPPKPPKKQNP